MFTERYELNMNVQLSQLSPKHIFTQTQNKKSPLNYTSRSESLLPSQSAQIVSRFHSFFYAVPAETNFQTTKRPLLEADRLLLPNVKLRTTKAVLLPTTSLYYLH
jgi:hypothetical protein